MSILSRYLTREIVKHFLIILSLVIIIYLAVDFFEKIDSFLEAGTPMILAFWFFLFKTPLIIVQMLPISLLLSVMVTFGIMSKHNELIALKSSGVSVFHLFKPVAVIGIACTALVFFLSEIVVPAGIARKDRIWLQDVKGGKALSTQEPGWIKGEHAFFKILQYNPSDQVIYGFTGYFLDSHFRLVRRLDANRGEFKEKKWTFRDLLIQDFNPKTGMPKVSFHDRLSVAIGLQPEDLSQIALDSDEMSSRMLETLIRKTEAEGDKATRYRVDLQYKLAFPVICLIMCLIGTGLAVRGKLREGLPIIVSYGIGIAFLYYIVLYFCMALGYGEILPPVAAAWAANFIFFCIGGVMLINAEQ